MNFIGIDIGSTASKLAVRGDKEFEFVVPTGWNSKETAEQIKDRLLTEYDLDVFDENCQVISTGYGRVSVPFSNKSITEITCHAKGAVSLMGCENCTVIDIGGQDTKVITVKDSMVSDFLMNDKCSAGTGRFLEIMANRMGISLGEMFEMAMRGKILKISSMCTVFAESEIIGLMGQGEKREDISAGIIDSVITKVIGLAQRHGIDDNVVLTGGLSMDDNFVSALSNKLSKKILTNKKARFAGAIGACLIAKEKYEKGLKR